VTPFGVAFGIACVEAGLSVWQAAAYSSLVFTGSAQFAAVEVIGDGGTAAAAIAAGLLLNLRSVAFGVVMAPALTGPRWKRALWSQLMIDESTAVGAAQNEKRWRRYGYLCSGVAIFVTWNVSTLVGAAGLSSTGDLVHDWGIDATIPAVFLALLWPRLADAGQWRSALAGALLALALVPVAPPGVPIVVAGLGVLAGWRSGPGEAEPSDDDQLIPEVGPSRSGR
jgi:predicted branched-subunit amino acid permease